MGFFYRLRFVIREGLLGLWRNRQRTVLRTTVSAAALALFGMMLTIHLNLGHIAGQMESQVELEVYLSDDISAAEVDALVQRITSAEGVAQYRYISKKDALAIAREMFRDNPALLETISEEHNPLPASFVITFSTPQQVAHLADALRGVPGVEQMRYGQEDIDKLLSLTAGMRVAGLAMTVFLAVVVFVFMSSIIEAIVESYAPEIKTMYNIGATMALVLAPFLVQGLILGLIGGALGFASTIWMYDSLREVVTRELAFIPMLPASEITLYLLQCLLGAGVGIGFLTSGTAAYRHIAVPRSYRQLKRAQLRKAAAAKGR